MHQEEPTQEYMHFGQVANFKTESSLSLEKFILALNSNLKKAIKIKKAEEVPEEFHARYNCKEKTYRYVIDNSEFGSAIYRALEYHVPQKLDVEKMKEAIKYFEGAHDFKAFKASGTSSKSSVRTIYKGKIEKLGEKIIIELTGNRFFIQYGKNNIRNTSRGRNAEKYLQKPYQIL